jgi:TPM domain
MKQETPSQPARRGLFAKLVRICKHRWMDERDVRRATPPELLARLERLTAASEERHTGEIRICIEAGLPMSYLWRDATPRERAVAMFGKLHVWDTAQNNGVLIYVLLAERAIEIIADRAVSRAIHPGFWQDAVSQMSQHFKRGDYERGLTQALEEISALLVQQFPADAKQDNLNELTNQPVVRSS